MAPFRKFKGSTSRWKIQKAKASNPPMLYVLLLEQNKIYVGRSERPVGVRFLEHFQHNGAKWTKMYRPLQVLEVRSGRGDSEKEDEDELTLEMMAKYGWWNVRGGSWCQVEMETCPSALLKWQNLNVPRTFPTYNQSSSSCRSQNFNSSNLSGSPQTRSCARCGRNSHLHTGCYAKTHISGYSLTGSSEKIIDSDNDSDDCIFFQKRGKGNGSNACYRCGRDSHFVAKCYAKFHINGWPLRSRE